MSTKQESSPVSNSGDQQQQKLQIPLVSSSSPTIVTTMQDTNTTSISAATNLPQLHENNNNNPTNISPIPPSSIPPSPIPISTINNNVSISYQSDIKRSFADLPTVEPEQKQPQINAKAEALTVALKEIPGATNSKLMELPVAERTKPRKAYKCSVCPFTSFYRKLQKNKNS